MGLDPGKRDRPVTIQQLTDSVDLGPVSTWSTLRKDWAAKKDVSGRERIQSGQQTSPFETTWELAYAADMDPDLVDVAKKRRLVYQGRAHDIVFGRHVGMKESIELNTLSSGPVQAL